MNEDFFNTPSDPSKIKFEIVRKYFWAWAKIIAPRARGNIAYIDLFSGKGVYNDGSKSIPVLILEAALRDTLIKGKLVTLFNDANPAHAKSLRLAIDGIVSIGELKNKPIVLNSKIGDNIGMAFKKLSIVPTLFFVDPWGYKGITLDLLQSVLKDWGCDCIFLFNYNRINMCFNNPILNPRTNIIFGEQRAEEMKIKVKLMSPRIREEYILNNLKEALGAIGGRYFLTFMFKDKYGKKTTHFLVFTSKSPLAYSIMKGIMANESSYTIDGVPSYIFTPIHSFSLFPLELLKELEELLLKNYAGKEIVFKNLFEQDNLDKPYIEKNYKQVLLQMEADGKIKTYPPSDKRRKNTMGENVIITFPK